MKWMIFYGGVFAAYGMLFFLAKRKGRGKAGGKVRSKSKLEVKVTGKAFGDMAAYAYEALHHKGWLQEKKVEKELNRLYPGLKNTGRVRQHYIDKISLFLLLLFLGNAAAAASFLSGRFDGLLSREGSIYRNPYGQGALEAELEVEIYGEREAAPGEGMESGTDTAADTESTAGADMAREAGVASGTDRDSGPSKRIAGAESWVKPQKEQFVLTIGERKYEKEALRRLAEELAAILPERILGQNLSPEEIRGQLNLMQSVDGYPFQISWESSNYGLVYSDGTVVNEEVKEPGETVSLTAILSYEDYMEERVFSVRVCPPVYTGRERLRLRIGEELKWMEHESRYGEKLSLPSVVDGRKLSWKERIRDDSWQILLFLCAAALLTCAVKDSRLREKVQAREHQMMLDYPGLVSKLTLYMGAGMTVRNAFTRIASDYVAGKKENADIRYAYEEMLLSCHELKSGLSESAVYEDFAQRCCLPSYTRLGNLLSQNLKKGSNGLIAALRQEARQAFEERKNTAKKLGEEAGTKLLFPMILMLGVVMVLIMIPAYYSFSF